MRKYKCSICGYVYDESLGIPEKGIPPGTKWEDLGENFTCPLCGAQKSLFKALEETTPVTQELRTADTQAPSSTDSTHFDAHDELSAEEISAICSSLAKGCEKQRLNAEMEAFRKISAYFKSKAAAEKSWTSKNANFNEASKMLDQDITVRYSAANNAAKANADRGALRSLVWSEKVSAMMKSLLDLYAKEGDAMLANTKIFVCDICGFIYIGDAPPDLCPVCKVQSHKLIQVGRR